MWPATEELMAEMLVGRSEMLAAAMLAAAMLAAAMLAAEMLAAAMLVEETLVSCSTPTSSMAGGGAKPRAAWRCSFLWCMGRYWWWLRMPSPRCWLSARLLGALAADTSTNHAATANKSCAVCARKGFKVCGLPGAGEVRQCT